MRDLPPLPRLADLGPIAVDPARFDAAVAAVRRRQRRAAAAATAAAVVVALVVSAGASTPGASSLVPTAPGETTAPPGTVAPEPPTAPGRGPGRAAPSPAGTGARPTPGAGQPARPAFDPDAAFPERRPAGDVAPCSPAQEASARPRPAQPPADLAVTAAHLTDAARVPGLPWRVGIRLTNVGAAPISFELRRTFGGAYVDQGERYAGGEPAHGATATASPTPYVLGPRDSVEVTHEVATTMCAGVAGDDRLPYGTYFLRVGVETDRGAWYPIGLMGWVVAPADEAGCFAPPVPTGAAPAPGLTMSVRLDRPPASPTDDVRAVVAISNTTGATVTFREPAPYARIAYLTRDGLVAGGWQRNAPGRAVTRTLSPGERFVTVVYVNGESCAAGQPMTPGTYGLVVGIAVERGDRTYYWTARAVAVRYPG